MADEVANPLAYIEEINRFPLQRRRRPIPGTVIVYGHANGTFTAPAGGYTVGEAWWLGLLIAHHVDVTAHSCALTGTVTEDGHRQQIEVVGRWQVVDPVAVVASRVTDAPALCQRRFEEFLASAESAAPGEQARQPWRSLLGESLYLSEGIRMDRLRERERRAG